MVGDRERSRGQGKIAELTVHVANTLSEACRLVEANFVTNMEGARIFRKREQ